MAENKVAGVYTTWKWQLSKWLMAKKIPLVNNRKNLGNVLRQGKTFFPAEC